MRKIDNKAAQGSQLIMLMMLMFLMIFIFGNQSIANLIAVTLNSVFYPLIGFDGDYPILTIALAGIMVVFLSSFFQNLFTDWKKMGETQETSKAFQKELSVARKSGNTNRVNKLMKMQPKIMKMQTETQSNSMKPMMFLFVFIVPIFMWLRFFLGNLPYYYFTLPWADGISLFDKPILMQAWLWMYMIFSFVLGQIIRLGMKYITWSDWWKNTKSKIIPFSK